MNKPGLFCFQTRGHRLFGRIGIIDIDTGGFVGDEDGSCMIFGEIGLRCKAGIAGVMQNSLRQ